MYVSVISYITDGQKTLHYRVSMVFKILHPCVLDKSSLSIGKLKIYIILNNVVHLALI